MPIYGFCNAGCKYEVYSKTDVDEKIELVTENVQNALQPKNFSVSVNDWIASTFINDYEYQATINITGITPNDRIDIAFDSASVALAIEAEILPSSESISNGVRLYAKSIPEGVLNGNYIVYKG